MMTSVKAHYDGKTIVLDSPVDFEEGQELVVTYAGSENPPAQRRSKAEIAAALYEFAGSVHSWDGEDALEYQRRLREEREIG